jgi:choline kinase
MKTIIFAGGASKRLRPLTEKIPKTLLKLDQKVIIEHILDALRKNNLRDVVLLTGHGHDYMVGFSNLYNAHYPDMQVNARYIDNYDQYGNVIALDASDEFLDDDILIINSDTIFHPDLVAALLSDPAPHAMLIDDHKTLGEEEMKVLVDDDGHITRIHKSLDPATSVGEYTGLTRLSGGIRDLIAKATADTIATDPSVYYEDALQRAIDEHGLKIKKVSTNGLPVMEIDTPEDLADAHELLKRMSE